MIVLLIAALAVVAVLVAGRGLAKSRAREHQRRERQDSARRAATAAQARAAEERRRAVDDASDALTSVMPAIKLPWPTQPPGIGVPGDGYGGNGYGGDGYGGDGYGGDGSADASYGEYGDAYAVRSDGYAGFRGDYPEFSARVPFKSDEDGPGDYADAGYADAGYGEYGSAEHEGDGAAGHQPGYRGRADDGPDECGAAPDRAAGYPEYPEYPEYPGRAAPPGRAAERAGPGSRPGDHMVPAPRPGEHAPPADHSRRRVGQGSHRGGHAKRRRG